MDTQRQLHEELCTLGITLSSSQEELLLKHVELVIKKNEVINLTRIQTMEDGITLHIVDSLLLLKYLSNNDGQVLDLGTGAGFPGIPLGIASEKPFCLCDSVKKKVEAVNGFLQDLKLDGQFETSTKRAEELAKDCPEAYGGVVARAVAPLPTLIEYATPLLCHAGVLIVTKGKLDGDELKRGNRVAELCGLSQTNHDCYELPKNKGHREILVYQKTGKSQVRLPRKVGKAKSNPLA